MYGLYLCAFPAYSDSNEDDRHPGYVRLMAKWAPTELKNLEIFHEDQTSFCSRGEGVGAERWSTLAVRVLKKNQVTAKHPTKKTRFLIVWFRKAVKQMLCATTFQVGS